MMSTKKVHTGPAHFRGLDDSVPSATRPAGSMLGAPHMHAHGARWVSPFSLVEAISGFEGSAGAGFCCFNFRNRPLCARGNGDLRPKFGRKR